MRQCAGERLHVSTAGLAVGIRTRQQYRGAVRDLRGQRQRVDGVGLDDGFDVGRPEDGAQSVGQVGRRGTGRAGLLDGGTPGGDDGRALPLCLGAAAHRGLDVGGHPRGDQVEIAGCQWLQQCQRVDPRGARRRVAGE